MHTQKHAQIYEIGFLKYFLSYAHTVEGEGKFRHFRKVLKK